MCGRRSWLTISSLPFDVRMEVRGAIVIESVEFDLPVNSKVEVIR
jgi:hypothetical protein